MGPRTDPCGTPVDKVKLEEKLESRDAIFCLKLSNISRTQNTPFTWSQRHQIIRHHRITHHSRIKYAASSWCGFATQQQPQQLQSLIKKLIRFNYLPASYPTVTQIFNPLDSRLFKKIENNNNHVILPLLPSIKTTTHNLRQRKHNYQVDAQSTYQEKIFITWHLKHIST
ncbi:hypothetical protein HELRODRAFT_174299 [Helobdella robusta]|uniref:Uncharacterized protein n=1 Tax=Helobdella robusta TaxID=6412 RepID=T1F7Y7_HELRO|nr:hypothetical protein HELRODRAFT_174299 [Helobdella robusta]ESO02862.1 hypothetical protein HELRODRAFT_174299 [Helobdella robusta]